MHDARIIHPASRMGTHRQNIDIIYILYTTILCAVPRAGDCVCECECMHMHTHHHHHNNIKSTAATQLQLRHTVLQHAEHAARSTQHCALHCGLRAHCHCTATATAELQLQKKKRVAQRACELYRYRCSTGIGTGTGRDEYK